MNRTFEQYIAEISNFDPRHLGDTPSGQRSPYNIRQNNGITKTDLIKQRRSRNWQSLDADIKGYNHSVNGRADFTSDYAPSRAVSPALSDTPLNDRQAIPDLHSRYGNGQSPNEHVGRTAPPEPPPAYYQDSALPSYEWLYSQAMFQPDARLHHPSLPRASQDASQTGRVAATSSEAAGEMTRTGGITDELSQRAERQDLLDFIFGPGVCNA